MTREAIQDLCRRWMHFWQGGSLEQFHAMHSIDFVDHSATHRAADRESFRLAVVGLYQAFPDFFASIDLIVVDESNQFAAIRWHATGHHKGPFLGFVATNRSCSFSGIEIIRVHGGLVVERWGEWDGLAIAQQLRPG